MSARFSPPVRAWLEGAFAAPTPVQAEAWETIGGGGHALVVAPTGSGKTLAAFLSAIDGLLREHAPGADGGEARPAPDGPGRPRTRVLYVSPLKALGVDVERNLRLPLAGVAREARALGLDPPDVRVGVRTGDTPAAERRRLAAHPPDILITTPESLYLLLTQAARETLRGVETVIVDEVHAVAGTKRGVHLALSLERLDALLPRPAQRIGLSATVRPVDEVARFLGGAAAVAVVAPPAGRRLELEVAVPVEDLTAPGGDGSVWPHVEAAILERILAHRSTIVFANSRRLAERLTAHLTELAGECGGEVAELAEAGLLARAHHGSVSKEQRALIESDLKGGRLRSVVATSSLELGIDMGEVDLVVQVEAPPSVASGLQRVGRAGHSVTGVSRGVIHPKHRGDLLHAAVAAERMAAGRIEAITVPANPLDVLAQQTLAAVALEPLGVDAWLETVRRAAPFAGLPRGAYESVLDLLAGRYPSDEFASLRPRLVWDREHGTLTARPGAQRLAVTSGGTIPDRGLFAVYAAGEAADERGGGRRVGELDEEMVYESRVGDVIALGATSWRISEINRDRVGVVPAPGQVGRTPFWHGDSPGRPAELGEALGAVTRELGEAGREDALARLHGSGLDERAAHNLVAYLDEQRDATGAVPDDRTLVLERFRDEIGDWRLVLHSPYGMRVHAPWALAVAARMRARHGLDASCLADDDGLVLRLPDGDTEPPGPELFRFEPEEVEPIVTAELGSSALFAARFRECAARALLLPGVRPGRRAPLWQQRQRSGQLLEVARRHPDFPIVLEALRECLQDVHDLPALREVCARLGDGRMRIREAETAAPSPFATSLLFGYIAEFLYAGDAPAAERRAAALSVDPALLGELLGHAELRTLLDPEAVAERERDLQRLAPERAARDAEGVADLLRILGPLDPDEVEARSVLDAQGARAALRSLEAAGRALRVPIAGRERYAAVEDAPRLRDALGVHLPDGLPPALLEPVADPLGDLVGRDARTHGPFTAPETAARLGLGVAVVRTALETLEASGRVVAGAFRPTPSAETEWCDAEVLRRLRRASLARERGRVRPVPQRALARFLIDRQHVAVRENGTDGVAAVVEQLAGARIPASAWESSVLPARVADYRPAMLDELTASGAAVWWGDGALTGGDGWVVLAPAEAAPLVGPPRVPETADDSPDGAEASGLRTGVLDRLAGGGAFFFRQLSDSLGAMDDRALAEDLWGLVWSGRVTNDTLAPLRARLGGAGSAPRRRAAHPGSRRGPGRAALPRAGGPPDASGRWSLLPAGTPDETRRAHALVETLVARHGIVTRGAVAAEGVPGGFAFAYRVLARFEENGLVRRGRFVTGLGAAQFAAPEAVDRLRAGARAPERGDAVVLAATDPANPYGAALPWPEAVGAQGGHRPGRKAGALVVLADGALAAFVERGGRRLLTFVRADAVLAAVAEALADLVRSRRLPVLSVERVDGEPVAGTRLGDALRGAGFTATPRSLRLRG